jgi:hypothetical protein
MNLINSIILKKSQSIEKELHPFLLSQSREAHNWGAGTVNSLTN